jgi:hypothetical protein
MYKEELMKRLDESGLCFICKKVLEKEDMPVEIFDKFFGKTVKVCKKHYNCCGGE